MIDRVFMESIGYISAARAALRRLEQVTCRIAAQRKTVSTGQACLHSAGEARALLGGIKEHLARYEARLQQLLEGVDTDAPLR